MIFGDAISPDGLTITVARAITLDEWSEAVEVASGLSTASPWWIGDLLALGERTYGESYAQGIPEDISPATIRGYQWVAERVPPANRHPGLSWSHHRAVSALPPAEQSSLLDQAEAEGWGVRELTQRAKGQEVKAQAQRTFTPSAYWVEPAPDGESNRIIFDVSCEDALEINDRLQSGKGVTFKQ